jgi:hypothetical protein
MLTLFFHGGLAMRSMMAILFILPACTTSAFAADKDVDMRSGHVREYVHMRRHLTYGGCPDHYSCYPLYGAYGPYGGRAYWAAYSVVLPEAYR